MNKKRTDLTMFNAAMAKDPLFGLSENFPKLLELKLAQLCPNPDQPRQTLDQEALHELAASIEKHGLIQPITVKEHSGEEGVFIVVAGERRWRAHELLNRETIFAILTTGNPDEIAIIENLQREDLNPIEESAALLRLMERHNYTQTELGQVIGKAQNTVSALLRLNDLPDRIKAEYPTSDKISKSVLIDIARLKSAEDQLKLWKQAQSGSLTVRATRQKKEQGEVRDVQTPTQRLISTGRSFIKKLKKTQRDDVLANRDQYQELLDLKAQFDDQIARISNEDQ
jgi:ParB family transcriptional regulator, chromosome partitioning protein